MRNGKKGKNSPLSPLSLQKKKLDPKQEKNVSSDLLDGRVGRVYVPRQDLADLPSAVMKGAKRERREGKEGKERGGGGEQGGEEKKRKKAASVGRGE